MFNVPSIMTLLGRKRFLLVDAFFSLVKALGRLRVDSAILQCFSWYLKHIQELLCNIYKHLAASFGFFLINHQVEGHGDPPEALPDLHHGVKMLLTRGSQVS